MFLSWEINIKLVMWYGQFYTKHYINKFLFKYDTVLYKFLKTKTSDRTFMGRDQELKCLGFSLYPLSFFFYSPFKSEWDIQDFSLKLYYAFSLKWLNEILLELNTLKLEKRQYLPLYWLDKCFKGTVVNQALSSLNEGSF